MNTNLREINDYWLLTLFIASSGFPYFSTPIIYILQFIILMTFFIYRKKSIDKFFLIFIGSLIFITILQAIKFDFFPLITDIGLFTRVVAAYLIIKLLENNFIEYYIRIIFFISKLSLLIYFGTLIFPFLGTFLLQIVPLFHWINSSSIDDTILIYNLTHLESYRNTGPFWEPSAFGGYLVLAFIFNYLKSRTILDKKNIVFIIAIATTLATTAYLALFVFLFYMYFTKIKNIFLKIATVSIIIVSGYYAFTTFEFLGKKIEHQLERARNADIRYEENTQRFLNIIRDWHDFQGHEIIGRGANPESRYSFGPENQIRTVGLTDILVKFGIPFFLLMLYFLYRSISQYVQYVTFERSAIFSIGIFSTILVTLMSEVYFNYPFYWSLLFLQSIYRRQMEHMR